MSAPTIPTSWGEVIDKITILEIKSERLSEARALANVRKELALLAEIAVPVLAGNIADLKAQLRALNAKLWDIEDNIRAKEAAGAFDEEFIALARSVYKTNDARGDLKRRINMELGSALMEEKSYKKY